MSSISSTGSDNAMAESRPLLWARLGSFVSIVPLGIWTVAHLWNNLSAFSGAEAWEHSVTAYAHPFSEALAFIIVFVPLLIHTGWGLSRLFSTRPNNTRYGYYGNLKYLMQRVTAFGLLLFLGAHVWLAFLHPRLVEGHAEEFEDIARMMHYHLPTLVVYLVGTVAVCYHLANGVQTFFWTWGLAAGRTSMRRLDRLALVLFVVLTAMAYGVIYALYQAGGPLGPPPPGTT